MLDGDSWNEIDRIFQRALDLKPEERDAFLDRECWCRWRRPR